MRWSLFRRRRRDIQIREDIEFHLQAEIDDNVARGMAPDLARTAARLKFGNTTLTREEIYRMNTPAYLENVGKDLRYSLRALRKSPVFAATAILTLALGIGGNTAIFTIIRAVLLRPLDYREPDRLVQLSLENPKDARALMFTLVRYEEARRDAKSFDGFGAYLRVPQNMTLAGVGEPEALQGARVSANFLEILGTQPILGRGFLAEEDTPGGRPVAIISSGLWKRRFNADPRIGGRSVNLDSKPHTVIGVLPEGFAFPFASTDVWVAKPTEWSMLAPRFWRFVTTQVAFGRLRRGVSLEQASAEMDVLNRRYMTAHPERTDAKPGMAVRIEWMKDRLVSPVRPMLWVLFGAVGFVLLIACANLASLLLARASTRSREFAVRAALGAGRARLIGQLLAESMLLSVSGGIAGVLLAKWCLALIPKVGGVPIPRAGEIGIDGFVLAFTVLISIATGLLFGLFPSLAISRPNLAGFLRQSGADAAPATAGRVWSGLSARGLLVVTQVALSIVLLIGAVLLIRSFARLRAVDPGFQTGQLLTMKVPLPLARYDTPEKRSRFYDQVARRLTTVPGVRDSALVRSIPTTPWLFTNVAVEGQPEVEAREQPSYLHQTVTPSYFRTMRVPLRRGREFTDRDNSPGAPPTIIVNESFARRFWPAYPAGIDPVGRHMGVGIDKLIGAEIIGIVADVHEGGLAAKPGPEFYVPLTISAPQFAYIVVRSDTDPLRLASAVRAEVQGVDRDQPISDIKTMEEVYDTPLGPRRLTMLLLATFAGIALLLAIIGLYGTIAYSVAQRTQELGIRRALGAARRDILRLVLIRAMLLTSIGVAIGLAGAFALTRLISTMLFGTSPTDLSTFAGVAVVFLAVALAAALVPAWRALRIDPMTALRLN